jgi:nucleoside-diphosphate-sugar epimerase
MIFILGGRGFVGSAFARVCAEQNRDFTVISRDNYADFIGQKCSLLINANGNSSKPLARKDPVKEFDESVRSVRRSLIDFQFDRYVYLSSCDVYPDCSSPSTTHEEQSLDVPHQSPYGFHKYLAEQCVQHAAKDWLIFRCGGFVGPGLKKNAIFDILNGGPLWLDPESELQFIHTNDAARIVLQLADDGIGGEITNLCGKGVAKLRDVIHRLGETVSVENGAPRVRYDVNVEKLAAVIDVPETVHTVFDFIDARNASRES